MVGALLAAGCGGGGAAAPPSTTTTTRPAGPTTSTTVATTTTTTSMNQASGQRTVLSPIGLNVRSGPSTTAHPVAIAAQGTVLAVLGHTSSGGGWYKVRGTTVTGWISGSPALSAPGRFAAYASNAFDVLYPAGWSEAGTPGRGVTFQAPSTPDKVLIKSAATTAGLHFTAQGAGVALSGSRPVLACGVTTEMATYTTTGPLKLLAEMSLPVRAHLVLGVEAKLSSSAQMPLLLQFVHSLSFPAQACVGGPSPTSTGSGSATGAKRRPSTSVAVKTAKPVQGPTSTTTTTR